MSAQCNKCGMLTNSPTGICAPCTVGMRVYEKLHQKIGGKDMATTEDRKCKITGCGKYKVKEGMCTRHYNEQHGIIKRIGRQPKKKTQVAKDTVIPAKAGIQRKKEKLDSPIYSGDDNPGSNGNYTIIIDFRKYPKLHERLINLAHDEFRTPEFQLMHMLNQEFQQMEARA